MIPKLVLIGSNSIQRNKYFGFQSHFKFGFCKMKEMLIRSKSNEIKMEPTIYQDNSNMFVRIYEYIRHKLLHFTLRYSSKIINRALFNVKPYVDYTDYHYKSRLNEIRKKKGFILDMDGTIWVTTKLGQRKLIKGVVEFFNWCRKEGKEFIMLTNGSMKNQKALRQRVLDLCNIDIPENRFVTSATSTASFIREQSPHFYTSVFAVGDSCLKEALEHEGIVHDDDVNPTFVVFGESRSYSYKDIVKAINLVNNGARLLATNSDLVDIDENGEMVSHFSIHSYKK